MESYKLKTQDLEKKKEQFGRLLKIMDELREKCPWDRKQTFESIRTLTVEEVYELSDSILERDLQEVKNELGDLLLHIVFYSKLGDEEQTFDVGDVMENLMDKLIRRHPHVFGDAEADTEEKVKQNWEEIKKKEKGGKPKKVLDGVPKSLPSLVKAYRIQEKASGVGFDWKNIEPVFDKVEEEINELHEELKALDKGNQERIEDEFGDLMFSMINLSRFLKINPDDALERANLKFIKRFNQLEEIIEGEGKQIKGMSLEQLDEYWERAKIM